jgi:Zn-finger nucleic acid-binding protein
MNLTCPKCSSEMRNYERNRILVDQCTGCGGLFLDRGELEQLAAAENAWHAEVPSAPAHQRFHDDRPRYDSSQDAERAHDDRRRSEDRREEPRYDDRRSDSAYKPRKKKSFLSELFED